MAFIYAVSVSRKEDELCHYQLHVIGFILNTDNYYLYNQILEHTYICIGTQN